jgi:hypothetical protein
MSQSTTISIGLTELVAAAFTLPLFSLVVASVIVAGALLAGRMRGEHGRAGRDAETVAHSVTSRYLPERRALGVGAIAVIVVFAIENVVRGYMLNLTDVVEWWQYATPVFAAFLCLTVVLGLIAFRGTTPPERPVVPTARRTWMSFGPRVGIVGIGVALIALLATTIAAGMASSADERGRFIYLEIPVANEPMIDPLRPWFYGWAYGVPVVVCLAALTAVIWATLRSNAVRPFLRPETVGAERGARVEVAAGTVRIATAGMLLALGGAWRFIARSGSIAQLIETDAEGRSGSYETIWRYAEFAVAAGWLAPALEITAFVLLLLVASRLRRVRLLAQSAEHTERQPDPQIVR